MKGQTLDLGHSFRIVARSSAAFDLVEPATPQPLVRDI
jgi:hypothetical protein